MAIKFTLYIDESGDAGIDKVRNEHQGGATPYMTLGGALVPTDHSPAVSEALKAVCVRIGKKDLHCNRLTHEQKVFYARAVAALPIKCFGMISLKETLRGYKQSIAGDHKKYYNKCVGYLLERVGHFLETQGVGENEVLIRLEEGKFNYRALRKFIDACRKTPHHENARYLERIDPFRIDAQTKQQAPLLQLGDLVAHSLFRCVDKSTRNYTVTETRYAKELEPVFWGHPETGRIVGHGIKVIHSLHTLRLDPDVQGFLEKFGERT